MFLCIDITIGNLDIIRRLVFYLLLFIVADGRREGVALYWVQLNRFHLKTKMDSSIRSVMFKVKERIIDRIQNYDINII
jgi:hypothetical protein